MYYCRDTKLFRSNKINLRYVFPSYGIRLEIINKDQEKKPYFWGIKQCPSKYSIIQK